MSHGPFNYIYQKWDGSQELPNVGSDEVFDEIRDSLLYHGDVSAALKQLLRDGFIDRSGNRINGIKDLVERLAQRRREILSKQDPSGILTEISEALDDIVSTEKAEINRRRENISKGQDKASIDARDALAEKQLELSMLGGSPASQIQSLRNYDFVSQEARQAFEELVGKVSQQMLDSFFNSMKHGLSSSTAEDLEKSREMLAELNSLLSDHKRGLDTDQKFEEFMEKWGSNFPPGINSVEDLIDFMTSQMRVSAAMFNSLSPEQRKELQELSSSLLDDIDLGWQMSQLSDNLAPYMGKGVPRYGFHGDQPFGLGEAPGLFSELGELSNLESFLRQVSSPSDLADVDLDQIEKTLGEDARASLEKLSQLSDSLAKDGFISNEDNQLELTPKGMRRIGESALAELFSRGEESRLGDHALTNSGIGLDMEYETKQYEYGDSFNLNINRTIRNALLRSGRQVPVKIAPEDFEVEKTEQLATASTVLLLDLSLSMPLRDNFLSAKKVAMALQTLISTKYPRDFLAIVGFSEVARQIEPRELPEVSWDYVYGTNMEHALLMAREILRFKEGAKQILMITDGEPTAHILPDGDVFFSYPSSPETIQATLKEAVRCTKEDIKINTFVLDATLELRRFMEKLASINKGRVFYTDPDNLGSYVLVDYLTTRSKVV